MRDDREARDALFRGLSSRYRRCLAPGATCKGRTIRAHSIQNRRALELLAESGHVIMPHLRVDPPHGTRAEMRLVGRNEATTFTGLCAKHDLALFKNIDHDPVANGNVEQLFLLAYRALIREFYDRLRAAKFALELYRDGFERGWAMPDMCRLFLWEARAGAYDAYSLYRYKRDYDKWYLGSEFDQVRHEVVELDVQSPTVAATSVYRVSPAITLVHLLEPELMVLNVWPERDVARIVFSSKRRHAGAFDWYHRHYRAASGGFRRYLLSKLVIANCSNVVLSPAHWRALSVEKREAIRRYYELTIREREVRYEHDGLMLLAPRQWSSC